MIERKTLLSKLSIVAPALAKTDFTPLLTEFWFNGSRVMAFNEQLSISVPLKTEFKGSVRGDALLSLLKLSKAQQIEMTTADENLHIKAASTKIKLGLRPREQSLNVFKMPKLDESKQTIKITPTIVEAFKLALRSVSTDSTTPDKVGVTLLPVDGGLHIFSTDDATMTRVEMPVGKAALKKRVIVTTAFCNQIITLFDDSKGKALLQVADDYVLAHFGDVEVFGHVIETESPLDFEKVFDHHYTAKLEKQFVPIPTKIVGIAERATMISESKTGRTKTKISVKDGKVVFYSLSPMGEVRDVMTLDPKHADVDTYIEARFLKAALGQFEKLLVTSDALMLSRKGAIHLISASAPPTSGGNAIRKAGKTAAGTKKGQAGGQELDDDIPF